MDRNSIEYKEYLKRRREYHKKHYSNPKVKERKRIYRKEYNKNNKKKISEYGYKLRARPEYQTRVKKWREENKEHLKKIGKEWREKNKERKKIIDREYQRKNKEKINKYHRKYRINNKKRVNQWYYRYNQSKKGKLNFTKQNHLRLSKKYGNEFKLTQEEIKKIFERDKVCVYCGSNNRLELDHIIPLIDNGKSIFENFVIACRKCNPSKSNKNVFDWCKLKNIEVPKIVLELLKKQIQPPYL